MSYLNKKNKFDNQLNNLNNLFINFIKEKHTYQYHIRQIKLHVVHFNKILENELNINSIIPIYNKEPFHILCKFIMIYCE